MDDHYSAPRRWSALAYRLFATAAAMLACGQPVLAGGFLQGHYSMLAAHRDAAMVLAGALLLALSAAVLNWRTGGAPGRLPVLSAAALLLCGGQIGLGFARELVIHVPLGVAIVALVLRTALLGWRLPLPRRTPVADRAASAGAARAAEVDA
ncbi:hypothetical protein [Streptacidiphilus sp. P02-A3a]|uniref:hypothetical protein n=1 Tax=Streptacidiphilus sp. P02-A3a TaxID=2704468 RepID=UPI0015FD5525|nr:hypothetical protein [Streptacidiphilus sp. P02-A3a]QMU68950.1 hypothetical protein GXP74_12585 [Streptacidiphilus sp. P02-A3a]